VFYSDKRTARMLERKAREAGLSRSRVLADIVAAALNADTSAGSVKPNSVGGVG
jgi:hypothetical protein